jgi:hypothetical protein
MGLHTMPNGEVVDLPDNVTPQGLARVEAEYKGKPRVTASGAAPAPAVDREQQEVGRRVARRRERGIGSTGPLNRGFLFNFNDELAGATSAVVNTAASGFNAENIAREYRIGRDVERQADADFDTAHPNSSMFGQIAGAVANPIGTGAGGVRGLAGAAEALGAGRVAAGVRGLATQMTAGPIRSAIAAGATQGALNAAGNAEELSDVPGSMGRGALIGSAAGGLLGGGVHLGRKAVQTIVDAMPANAKRTAMMRISQLLDNANISPEQAARRISTTDARGGDEMVMDLSPGLRAEAAHIARRPNVPSSNRMIQRAEDRITDRNGNFAPQVAARADDLPTNDAFARTESIVGSRKAAGQRDYAEGGAMDEPLVWNDDLDKFMREAPPVTNDALRSGYQNMLNRREVPAVAEPTGTFTHVPNLRTFDYVKRGFDDEISKALKAGRNADAQALSEELNSLKALLVSANPKYGEILETQRDLFRQAQAVELGETAMAKLRTDPRQLLRDLKKLPDKERLDARIGIIDALMAKDTAADPVGFFQSVYRNAAQRKVMEFAFGSRKQVASFKRWVDREARARATDSLVSPGRQSATSTVGLAADDGVGGSSNILTNAMRGWAFGGPVGAASGALRSLQQISQGVTHHVQEEIAKILMSKGQTLADDIGSVAAYKSRRDANNKRIATVVAKGAQQPFSSVVAGE